MISRSISPPIIAPARSGWSSGISALRLGRRQDRRPEPLGQRDHRRRSRGPRARRCPARMIGRRARASISSAGFRLSRSGRSAATFGSSGTSAGQVGRLLERLVGRQVELDRPRRRRGHHPHRAAQGVPHGPRPDRRVPLGDRVVQRKLIEPLAQAGRVGRRAVLVGDRDQRAAVHPGVGDAVDHVGGAGRPRRHADARASR